MSDELGIEYSGVWKYFGGKAVVKDVSLGVKYGEVKVLLGPNGSGKSTLFKMSVGVVKPDKGAVKVGDVDPVSNALEARRLVGYVPEDPVLYESLEITEYLNFILSVYGVKVSESKVSAVIKALGLEEHLGKLIGELSHGNKRKVMIAAVMLRDPNVLVLDEVFSGLDASSARVVKRWIREKASRGAAVLVSTHILPLAEVIADEVAIIHEGKIVAEGTPKELKELLGSSEFEDVYLKLNGYSRELEELITALST